MSLVNNTDIKMLLSISANNGTSLRKWRSKTRKSCCRKESKRCRSRFNAIVCRWVYPWTTHLPLTVWVYPFKFSQWAPKDAYFVQCWPFKVIHGCWLRYKSKALT